MPAYARKDIVREGEVATYHCWSRCVQKAYLCGDDPETGRDFSYRRGWIEDLLAYQAGVFALDVGNFNVLSNHAHTILRTRPDIAATWLAEFQQLDSRCSRVLGAAQQVLRRAGEVAQRWFQGLGWCREIFVDAPSDTFT